MEGQFMVHRNIPPDVVETRGHKDCRDSPPKPNDIVLQKY
jgi:hypothetical protein